jgi:amidase
VTRLWEFSAGELASLIRTRTASSEEVVSAHLERIAAVNADLRAVVQLRGEAALAEACAADRVLAEGEHAGPLHGVPFTVKDWIETQDLPCAAGFEERRGYIPHRDAPSVARLRAAGGILLGKTQPGLDDTVYPLARNPHGLDRTPGGSSAGEAAITAAGGSPLGLGSDSGGSLRWPPAHCCGVATLKPTAGLVPLTGHYPPISPMLDPRTVIGPMARRVEDLWLALRVIAGPDGQDASCVPMPLGDPGTVEISAIRVAFHTAFPGGLPNEEAVSAVESAAAAFEREGARVVEAFPPRLEESLTITQAYWARPESMDLGEWRPHGPSSLTADEVERSLFEWDRFRRSMLGFMADYDVVLSPAAEGSAPLADAPVTGETYRYTLPYSLTGQPVALVRAGTSAEGFPLGVQIAAGNWRDHLAVAGGWFLEVAAGPWDMPLREPSSRAI